MDELFRFNVVRPPNGVATSGVPLDYATLQSPYPSDSFLGLLNAAMASGGGGMRGGRGTSRKDAARAAANAVQNVFRTQHELLAEPLLPSLQEFRTAALKLCLSLVTLADEKDHGSVALAAADVGGLKTEASFQALQTASSKRLAPLLIKLVDSFLAQFTLPRPIGPSLSMLAEAIRATRLAMRLINVAPDFLSPNTLLELEDAAEGTMMLPGLLQLPPDRIQPVGVADLLVVRQRLLRYEPADIQRIENIQKGENRGHTLKRSVTQEAETTTEEETQIETSKSLDSTDRSELKDEVQSSLQETLNTQANLEIGYGEAKAGTWHFKLTARVQYNRVSQESAKFSSTIGKEVTQKAASKITQRVKQTRRTKTTEVVEVKAAPWLFTFLSAY